MECHENLANMDEEDLLDEIPDRSTTYYGDDKISLSDANKDDSGLEISDSLETLKENAENQLLDEFGCDTSDATYTNKSLPELIPLPMEEIKGENVEGKTSDSSCSANTSHDKNLPELQPISELFNERKDVAVSEESSIVDQTSRRSSTSSFIDSLLNKLRRNNSESSGSDFSPKKIAKECKSSDEDLLVEINKSVTFTTSSNPNMLPTPVVENQSISSVFVDSAKEYEEAVERNKHKPSKSIEDKAKMTAKSQPPRMKAPKLPPNIQHPRTLAQKRLLLSNNVNLLVIEQESKLYKEIQKKMNGRDVNYRLIDFILDEEIPIKYGPWKALSWLRTKEGNYIKQFINIDGHNYKLSGSKGNHPVKFLSSQSSKPFPKTQTTSLRSVRCCEGGRIKKRIIDNLVNVESIKRFILEGNLSPYRKLETKSLYNQLSSIKPRPLTKKIEYINRTRKLKDTDEDSVFLGDYVKFKMPNIKLEVKPQYKIPLDPIAKQYLNEIIPYRDMNENWINFSLSTMVVKEEQKEDDKKSADTFEFKIPYCDGKQHILGRKISKVAENFDSINNPDEEMQWTFDENCDKDDPIEMEVIEIIKDLTNSVHLNLNDDLFTKDDPIQRIPTVIAPIKTKAEIQQATSKNLKDQSKKMLMELRRLNANVVKSDSSRVEDEEDIRRHALAHLAKDERELRQTVILTQSDTVILSNKKTETRRQKRAPKRFSDYMNPTAIDENEKDTAAEPPKKFKPKELIDEPFKARTQSNDTGITHEEVKTLKEEVKKWIHVNVEIMKLKELDDIQPWCMIHNLYKCSCKRIGSLERARAASLENQHVEEVIELDENKEAEEEVTTLVKSSMEVSNITDESTNIEDSAEEMEVEDDVPKVEDDNARRVMPIELDRPRKSICEMAEDMDLEDENKENAPKMEIQNISELVNGGIGPIYINIYDTKVNRLNLIFRSILNNKSALVYVDGLAYYIDMKRIDVMRLKFDNIRDELEHPVFIICPKVHTSPDEEVKICDEFVNLLFKEDSEQLLQIKDKGLLKEIARIIEVILQSVRRKIAAQIGSEPTDFVKEQLSLITRDRSNSNSSASSADTSPLHFNGKKLECAPSPGFDTQTMKEFNQIFSMRMQRLCAIIRSNSLGLYISDGYINKFYIYKWNLLLQSFEEDMIHIWQVKLNSETNDSYYTYVITNTSTPPSVENADNENIVNVKQLPLSSTSVLIRMILLRMENAKTKNMTVILFGCKGYFRICGLLNSKNNYVDKVLAKPSRDTHPRLTAKIQKVYNIWYGLKKAKNNLAAVDQPIDESKEDIEKDEAENESDEMPKIEDHPSEDQSQCKQPSTYKWFLFNVANDFSDIYIKQWKNYLSHNVIMSAIYKAKARQQTIRILGPLNSAKDTPRIFALPRAPLKFKKEENDNMTGNFLIFGPYLRDSNSNLLLMQNVGGKMVPRDVFEEKNKIQRTSKTRCLWIYANSLKCVTDSAIESIQPTWSAKSQNGEQNENHVNGEATNNAQHSSKKRAASEEQLNSLKISKIVGGFKKVL